MKKIISIAVTILFTLMLFLNIGITKVYGIVEDSGYVILDDNITSNFTKEELETEDMTISLHGVESNDKIYVKKDEYYVGEDRTKINKTYPIITNNGNSINIITDLGQLITDEFIEYETFPNIFLTNGALYQGSTRERLDDNNYILYRLSNNLYMNTLPMKILAGDKEYNITLNSVIQFEEDNIKAYSLTRGTLSYRSANNLDSNTKIILGDKEYNYEELVERLKKAEENNKGKEETKDKDKNKDKEETNKENGTQQENENLGSNNATNDDNLNNDATQNRPEKEEADVDAPEIMLVDIQTSVYSIIPRFKILDTNENLLYPIDFKVYEGDKLTLRKSVKKDQDVEDFKLSGLKPNTEYELEISYKYLNSKGEHIEKNIKSPVVKTQDISELKAIDAKYENGDIYSDSIQLKNIAISSEDEEALNAITNISLVKDDKAIGSFSKDQLDLLKSGEVLEAYTSPKTLDSNKNFDLKLVAYDRFENELLINNNLFYTRTSKIPPSIKIKKEENNFTSFILKYTLENKDKVDIENKRFEVVDKDGNVEVQGSLDSNGFINTQKLQPNTSYSVKVYGDYDLNDNNGLQKNIVMGETGLKTPPLNSLGSVYSNATAKNISQNIIEASIKLNKEATDERILDYINKAVVKLGDNIIELSDDELERYKNGEELTFRFENLKSATTYLVEVRLFFIDNKGNENKVSTTVANGKFETLKTEPKATLEDVYTYSGATNYSVFIEDKEGAIKDGSAKVVVKDKNGKVVSNTIINTNEKYSNLKIQQLNKDEKYTISVIAPEYNLSSDDNVADYNKELVSVDFINRDSFNASLKLNKMEEKHGEEINLKFTANVNNIDLVLQDDKFYIEQYKGNIGENGNVSYNLEKTYEYVVPRGEASVGNVFNKDLEFPVNKGKYQFKLYANIYGKRIELSKPITFTAEGTNDVISESGDLNKINKNPNYNYLIINDLDLSTSKEYISKEVNGIIDFDGNSVTLSLTEDYKSLFNSLSAKGQIKNVKLNIKSFGQNYTGKYGLVEFNRGKISDIEVTVEGNADSNTTEQTVVNSNYTSAIAKANYGTIEKFIIILNGNIITTDNFGLVAADNYGTIQNGYMYGDGSIQVDYSNKVERVVGGLVGTNYGNGKIKRAYSYVVVNSTMHQNTSNVGNIVGKNLGSVSKVYSDKIGNYLKPKLGPTVGYSNGNVTESYYYLDPEKNNKDTNNNNNINIAAISLTSDIFMENLYDKSIFDMDFQNEEVYYPTLKSTNYIKYKEHKIRVPEDKSMNEVALVSTEIEDKASTSAKLILNIKNLRGDVTKVDIPNAEIKDIAQEKNGRNVKVTLTVSAIKHYENYFIKYIEYEEQGEVKKLELEGNGQLVKLDFYKPINSVKDWEDYMITINDSNDATLENYILESDLDFANAQNPKTGIRINKLNGNGRTIRNLNVTINQDGAGYIQRVEKSLENLTFENINLQIGTNGQKTRTGLIHRNLGEIRNVKFDGININKDNLKNELPNEVDEFINKLNNWNEYFKEDYKAEKTAIVVHNDNKLDNIEVVNSKIISYNEGGGLVVENGSNDKRDATITNVNARNNVIASIGEFGNKDNHTKQKYAGGIVAYNQAKMDNINVDNNKVISKSNRVGGIIGSNRGNSSIINNLYTSNSIVYSRDSYVGGLVSFSDSANFLSVGSNDSHVIGDFYVGGLAGNIENLRFEKAFVNGGSVRGNNRVGGAVGTNGSRSKGDTLQDIYCVTDVYAGNGDQGVGSLIGYLDQNGSSLIQNAYVGSRVFAENSNAPIGILGRASGKTTIKNILTYATYEVKDVSRFDYRVGNKAGKKDNIWIWEGSRYNEHYYTSTPNDAVSSDELKTEEFYTKKLKLSPNNWSFAGLPTNMPKIIFNGTLLPNQPNLPVPEYTPDESDTRLADNMSVYTVGADSINLEFSKVDENLEFEIFINDESVIKNPIDREVFTFKYDFVSELLIEIKDKEGKVLDTYEVKPNDINRRVLLQDDKHYYITSEGIKTNDKLIEGDFVNIYKGYALTSNGDIVNIETGKVESQGVKGIKLLGKIRALFEFLF